MIDISNAVQVSAPSKKKMIKKIWPYLRWIIALCILALVISAFADNRKTLSGLEHIHFTWWYLVPAFLCEMFSMISLTGLQRKLLRSGRVSPPLGKLFRVTLGGQAMANSIPGGGVFAAIFTFRWYKKFGADDALAGWAIFGLVVGLMLSLSLLAVAGLILALQTGKNLDLIPVTAAVFLFALVIGMLFTYERPLSWITRKGIVASRKLTGRPRDNSPERINALVGRITHISLGWRGGIQVVGYGLLNWSLDAACFAFGFLVVGGHIPWQAILLAYGAGQLASNISILPGGLGAVEGSIAVTLAFFIGINPASIGAILVYRLFNFWLLTLVGWGCWGSLVHGMRKNNPQIEPIDQGPKTS